MAGFVVRAVDLAAVTAAVLAAASAALYVDVMRAQGDEPLAWVLVVLLAGALAAAVSSPVHAPHRRALLWTAGAFLCALGLLAILSIGFLVLLAGALALVAGARRVAAV